MASTHENVDGQFSDGCNQSIITSDGIESLSSAQKLNVNSKPYRGRDRPIGQGSRFREAGVGLFISNDLDTQASMYRVIQQHNAKGPMCRSDERETRQVMKVNVWRPVHLTRDASPQQERGHHGEDY